MKLHKAHKLTPAMAAGITDKLWSVEDIVALVETSESKPGKCGPYKKRERPNLSCPAGGRPRGPVLRLIAARSGPSL